jgi:FkbM family methyltransferase
MNILKKIIKFPQYINGYLLCDPKRNGEYKFLAKQIRTNNINNNFILFDIGSNIGDYLKYAKSLDKEMEVHCFEPVKKTLEILNKNQNLTNVYLNEVAISNFSGYTKINIYGDLYETNSIFFNEKLVGNQNVIQEEIKTNTVDNYIHQNNINHINFMKIDTEGHEIQVLEGASESINAGLIDVIQFEYNYLWLNTENRLQQAFSLLEKKYEIFRLTPWGMIYVQKFQTKLENFPSASNYVAIRKLN